MKHSQDPFILFATAAFVFTQSFAPSAMGGPDTVTSQIKIADGLRGVSVGTFAEEDRFGTSSALLGDIDGDGIPDMAVGAAGDDTKSGGGGASNGAVYILFLNADGSVKSQRKIADGMNGLTAGTLANQDQFGRSCAGLGDLDGDGVPDLVVGAAFDDTQFNGIGDNNGAVYILLLNGDGTVKDQKKIADGEGGLFGGLLLAGDQFGTSCAAVGDLDGDGVSELAVGAAFDDTQSVGFGGSNGAVYILFLNADGTMRTGSKIADGQGGLPLDVAKGGDRFGASCAALGDLDGDGIPDLAVGAEGDGGLLGAAHVLFLSANGTVKGHKRIANGEGGLAADTITFGFGNSCSALGDLDGDGITDLAVGEYFADIGGIRFGAVHILFLNADGSVKRQSLITNGMKGLAGGTLADRDFFGRSCAALGDLDGDGVPELAVGADGDDTAGESSGAVHILSLGSPPLKVTTGADEFDTPSLDGSGKLSLREALRDVATTDGFQIAFDPALDGQTITLDGTQLDLTADVSIDASSLADGLTINGNDLSRVLSISPGVNATLNSLTITGGHAPDGLDGATPGQSAEAHGEAGGGIVNDGTLTLIQCTVSGNQSGDGGEATPGDSSSPSGRGGDGGGILNNGTLTLDRCLVSDNRTGDGGGAFGTCQLGGDGGGIANLGTLNLTDCTISGNRSGAGGSSSSLFGTQGHGGVGGGIANEGSLIANRCTISGNFGGDGGDGGSLTGSGGIGGEGGGLYNLATMTLVQCTVSGNLAGDGGDGGTGDSGGGGDGGGIDNGFSAVSLTLIQTTISGNRAGDGGNGIGPDGNPNNGGRGGRGGGIGKSNGGCEISVTDSIVAGNFVGNPGTGLDGGTPGEDGQGPDIESDSNSTSSGLNLIGDNTIAGGGASTVFPAGPFVGTDGSPLDPLLGELADNGGPTPTMLPLRGSPAIDPVGGATTSAFLTDQDGFARIVGGIMDIGAVEAPDYDAIDAAAAEAARAAQAAAAAQANAAAAAQAQAAARAAQLADFSKKIKKLKKKAKNAKRKGQASKAKKLKKQIKKLTKQMRAL